jgi:hypothetical protein
VSGVPAATIAIVKVAAAVVPTESLTWAVNVKLPVEMGVPESRPVAERVKPGGRVPEVWVNAYGGAPPVAVSAET